jgi:hypothetical protein
VQIGHLHGAEQTEPPFLLGKIVGNDDYLVESHLGESASAGRAGFARSIGDAAESTDADRDVIFEEAFNSEATQDIQVPSDFSVSPPNSRRQIKEIKDLISELMPEESKTEPDKKMDDSVTEHDLSISRGDKEFVTREQAAEGDFVGGLEELDLAGVGLEGLGGWRKRQLEDSEGVTRQIAGKKLTDEEE